MKLIILEEGTRSELSIDRPAVSIGRAVDNDIRLSNTLVSRHHCRIEVDEEGTWLVDLGSANGTSVNGDKVRRRALKAGDQVQVGGVSVTLEAEPEDSPAPPPGETQMLAPLELAGDGDVGDGYRTLTGEAMKEQSDLHVFARITRELACETELAPLLQLIVDSAVALVGGERGFLLLAEEASGDAEPPERTAGPPDVARMKVRVARAFDKSDIALPQSRLSLGIARQVVEECKPILSVDAGRDERFTGMASVEDLKLRSVIGLPIRIDGRSEGVLYVDNRLQQHAFTDEALDLGALFADQAAIAIQGARRLKALRDKNQRLEQSQRQIERLNEQLGRKVRDRDTELSVVRAELGRERGRYDYTSIVGASDGMHTVFQQLDRIIESDLPVLIEGESGTGKELIARAIHFNSPRAKKPFVIENCAALPDSLLESELFGHARGAFTGAHKQKRGLLEQADGGTLFLDEIGDMSSQMQKKLLRVLQEGEFRPVGSDRVVKVDIRLLSASNVNLEDLVGRTEFREDLFYRINVLSVRLPALRERRDDIPVLTEHLLARAAREANRPVPSLTHEVLGALVAHDWSGNVRELENEMRRIVLLTQGEEARLEHLSSSVLERRSTRPGGAAKPDPETPGDIKQAVADLERRSIEAALAQHGGNKSKAAGELGISRFALQRKLDKYGLGARKAKGAANPDEARANDGPTSEDGTSAEASSTS
jgi:transcriptional regulator with GAF, ATPase, and Fis domain